MMRLLVLLTFISSLAGVRALSAQGLIVMEMNKDMSFGSRPGFSISFPNTTEKLVDETWTSFIKNNFNGKLKKGKKGEKSATGLLSPTIASGQFNLYSRLEKIGDGVQLDVWFDVGPHFLSRLNDPARTNETKELLTRFYYDVRRAAVGQEVKEEENKMKDLENRQKKLQRENTTLLRDIENYKAKLKKAEEDLIQNQKDQESTIIDIEKQRQGVEQARLRQGNVENERQ